jgi:DNA-binding helix-hairpin-helix protein with protein kinase domain
MAYVAKLRTAAGQTIVLGKEIGKGGEGAVFAVEGASNLAAKIYHNNIRASRADKIAAMTSAAWHTTARNVAFPIDALFDPKNAFAGFTMPRVGGHQPVHNLYSPTSRKTSFPTTNNFRFLLRTAVNIARSLANVHGTGCVVGDINHSGILVAHDATATWIDCDSFQVNAGGRLFPCTVGVPEFTPPELQGRSLDRVTRTADHDAFGLAVVIFNLLFMGRHPFSGRFLGSGDMPLEKSIAEFRFAYSARESETRTEPPPGVPLLTDIPPDMRDAFEMAFGEAGVEAGRPKAADWVRLTEAAEKEMIACKASAAHHYFNSATSCPWCRMEATFPGFVAFTTVAAAATLNPTTLAELIAAIRAAPDPGPAPRLAALMPAFQGQASAASVAIRDRWEGHYIAGILLALLGSELVHLPAPVPGAGVLFFLGGIFLACREIDPKGPLRTAVAQADKAWQTVEKQWARLADNQPWLATRRQADDLIQRLQRLGGEETNRIAGLKTQQRAKQLQLFLERYPISQAEIKGIGDGRKATLRSYGIETAADIERSRIESISGFGPAMAGTLLSWRASIERVFIFDSTQPVSSADIRAIKNDIARQSADLATQLRQSLSNLQQSAASVLGVRASLRAFAVNAWNRLKQCELDAAATSGNPPPLNMRRGIFAVISVVGFLVVHGVNSLTPGAQGVRNSSVPSPHEVRNSFLPNPQDVRNSPVSNSSSPALNSQNVSNPPDLSRFIQRPAAPALPDNVQTGSKDRGEISELKDSAEISGIQALLQKYGFLPAEAAGTLAVGTWDQATRDAFRDFKAVNGLAVDDVWDDETRRQLNGDTVMAVDRSFIGKWARTTDQCGSGPFYVINSLQAKSSSGVLCRFRRIDRDRTGWQMRADCSLDDNKRWTSNIRIQAEGGQLSWTSERDAFIYYRCK